MTEKGSRRLVDAKGGGEVMLDKDICNDVLLTPNLSDPYGFHEAFKTLFLDWLRFYRANMSCLPGLAPWDCPGACQMQDDCTELDRVWLLWLDTLDMDYRAMLN